MDEIILHPSKGSGVQAGPSPESKLEFRGWKRASFSAGLRDLKERMFLFGSSCGLSPVFKNGCWPAPFLVTAGTGSSLEMGWSFDWVGDVHMCLRGVARL